jgi:hypothetical protein
VFVIHLAGDRGIDFLGSVADIQNIIYSAGAAFFINVLLIYSLYKRLPFFAHVIAWFNVAFTLLIFISVAGIISGN